MFFRPTIQVELEPEDKSVKEIYIRGEASSAHCPYPPPPPPPPPPPAPRTHLPGMRSGGCIRLASPQRPPQPRQAGPGGLHPGTL